MEAGYSIAYKLGFGGVFLDVGVLLGEAGEGQYRMIPEESLWVLCWKDAIASRWKS